MLEPLESLALFFHEELKIYLHSHPELISKEVNLNEVTLAECFTTIPYPPVGVHERTVTITFLGKLGCTFHEETYDITFLNGVLVYVKLR